MSATFKRVFLAKDVPISLIPLTISAGVISEGSSAPLTGLQGDAEEERSNILTEASANDGLIENYVAIKGSFRLTLSALRMQTTNPLANTQLTSPYVSVVVTGETEIRKYSGVIQNFTGSINAEKNLERLVVLPIDTGEDNPIIASV